MRASDVMLRCVSGCTSTRSHTSEPPQTPNHTTHTHTHTHICTHTHTQVLNRRSVVESALSEDARHMKQRAMEAQAKLEAKKKTQLARLQREHEEWRRRSDRLDPDADRAVRASVNPKP